MKNALISIIILIIAGVAGWYFLRSHKVPAPVVAPLASVSYLCDGGQTIDASFYDGTTTPAILAGQPPMPTGHVALTLDDGRTLELPQTISADGARYANSDESFVFWSKGQGALVTDGSAGDYTGCIQVADDPGSLPQAFASSTLGFSIRYPAGYTPAQYQYQEMGPGKDINGVKFTIDAATAAGTNLGSDSYLGVEELPKATSCTANLFLDAPGLKLENYTQDNTLYSLASSTGAAAGNRYEEWVYAIQGTSPCVAVRYFIHYGVIDNYPVGAVQQFDEAALLAQFDAIRETLMLK